MRRIGLIAALVACVAMIAAPVSAKTKPVGEKLELLEPCFTGSIAPQPADTPFHVVHGWLVATPPEAGGIGLFGFVLAIDGEPLKGKLIVEPNVEFEGDYLMDRDWLFNFPDGLSVGTYTFDYAWTSPDEMIECTLEVEFTG